MIIVHYKSTVKYIFVSLTGYLYTLHVNHPLQTTCQVNIYSQRVNLYGNVRLTCKVYK